MREINTFGKFHRIQVFYFTGPESAFGMNHVAGILDAFGSCAHQGERSYKPDSETTFREMMKQSQMNQYEFQEWLYSYKPA